MTTIKALPQGIKNKLKEKLRETLNQNSKKVLLYLLMESKERKEEQKSKTSPLENDRIEKDQAPI